MANRKRTTKPGNGGKIATALLCVFALVAVGLGSAWVTGWQLTGEANPVNWVKTPDTANVQPVAIGADGERYQNGGTYAMPRGFTFLSSKRLSSEVTEYGAGGEITVTASLSNEYINGEFDWAVDFSDSSAEWAAGKVATYYVQCEPTADGAASATLKYLAPFSEQITVTATLRGSETSATCTVDCLKMPTLSNVCVGGEEFGEYLNVESGVTWSEAGTLKGEFEFISARVALADSFINKFKNHLTFAPTVKAYFLKTDVTTRLSGDYILLDPEEEAEWGMFIEGFDEYDEAHKEAIYWAWYQAYCAMVKSYGRTYSNLLIDVEYAYKICGVQVATISENDVSGIAGSRIYGSEGEDISPSVTLNKNVVF